MFVFKSQLTTIIYLVVISIIHHVHTQPNPELEETNPELEETNPESVQANPESVQATLDLLKSNLESLQLDSELVQTNLESVQVDSELVQTCENILKGVEHFNEDDDAGRHNFVNAFKMLSLTQIEYDINELPEERRQKRVKSKVRHYVTKLYFLDLFFNHKIAAISQLKTPHQWCEKRITEVYFDPEIHRNKREQMADCLEYTTIFVKNPSDSNNPNLIFEAMYKNWCHNDIRLLLYTDQIISSGSMYEFHTKRLIYNVEKFTEPYFNYYEEFLHELDNVHGNFRSIKEYCELVGYLLLQGVQL